MPTGQSLVQITTIGEFGVFFVLFTLGMEVRRPNLFLPQRGFSANQKHQAFSSLLPVMSLRVCVRVCILSLTHTLSLSLTPPLSPLRVRVQFSVSKLREMFRIAVIGCTLIMAVTIAGLCVVGSYLQRPLSETCVDVAGG